MKKTRINLLISKQDYNRIDGYFKLFRTFLVAFCLLLLFVISGLAGYRIYLTTLMDKLTQTKKAVYSQLENRKTDEVKLMRLSSKLASYQKFIKEDVHFIPYYELLISTFEQSSQSATLREFNIDKSRAMNFNLSFNSFDEMLNTFKFIESSNFAANFEKLDMVNFVGTGGSAQGAVYQLSFEGTFKPIDETQN